MFRLLSWITLMTAVQAILNSNGQGAQESGQSPLLRVL